MLDGYVIANPKLKQPQYHFISNANTREADLHFDPRKRTALLYRRTPKQEYKLEGVMFTASPDATEEEPNERIPLSIARWHRHINYCEAPEDRINDYQSAHPKFGMFGSINTEEAGKAERGSSTPKCSPGSTFPRTNPTSKKFLHERRRGPRALIHASSDPSPGKSCIPRCACFSGKRIR